MLSSFSASTPSVGLCSLKKIDREMTSYCVWWYVKPTPAVPPSLSHAWFPALRFRSSVAVSPFSVAKVRKNCVHP